MQPGQFNPRGEDWIVRELQDIKGKLQRLEAANIFGTMGIEPNAGGFTVTGTLGLPAGIIDNAALSDPIVISTAGVSQNNFATTTSATVYASTTVTIPAGYSRADVLCMVVGGAINSTASADFLYVAASIDVTPGSETPQLAAASGGYASSAANGIRSLTGLSGGTITVGCQIRSGAAVWAASTSNIANVNAVIYFRR